MQINISKLAVIIVAYILFSPSLSAQITLTPGNGYLSQPSGVVTYVIKKEGITDPVQVLTLNNTEKVKTLSYADGFARPLHNIIQEGSPNGKDIVSFSRYDEFGRQPKQYLSYEASTSNGTYTDITTTLSNQLSFYSPSTAAAKKIAGDVSPFAESSFETSPLQRVLKTGGVGDGFQLNQHYKTMNYRNGTAAENILNWALSVGGNATANSTYGDNDLTVSEVTDENNIHAWVYKDKFERLILKRQDGITTNAFYDTYYVYDNLGNIVYIVPPKAIAKMINVVTFNTALTPELIFQFWYDGKNRVVRKKVPGAKEVYIIYDPLDRVVLTQDGNMRSNGGTKWAYVKYDNANRVIIQGIYTDGSVQTQSQMQTYVDGLACYQTSSTTYYEVRQPSGTLGGGTSGYSNQCFPATGTEERAYGYFDDYDFDFDGTPDYSQLPQGLTNEATATNLTYGLATGSKRKVLGTSIWLTDISFYDKYYHVIQLRSSNQLDNTVNDHTTNVITFTGKVTHAKQYKSLSSLTVTVSTRYEYDAMERLTKIKQTNPGAAEITVAKYEYNALGQLVDKKLHSPNDLNYLQSVDMRYNIRGQLTSINNSARVNDVATTNTNDETNDVFGMELLYEKPENGLNNQAGAYPGPAYTGMIYAIKWSAKTPANPTPDERSFKYTYDNLYRLTASTYQAKTGGSWTKDVNGFNESLTYDENGNITGLQRNAVLANVVTAIDNLTYTYKSSDTENQLDNITDGITTNATGYGYRNYTGSSNAYTYDDNGNLKTDPKKGTILNYNELNKLTQIKNASTSTQFITYRYDASGARISKNVYNGSSTIPVKTVEYIGGYVMESGVLSYYGMAEGRVRNDGGGSLSLKMEYFISDHQGNTRVSFEDDGTNSNTAVVTQENSYYAFGMQMAGGYTPTNPNKQLYNAGSEWQDDIDGLADYYSTFYREYDPIIGRFNSVDPMAEATDNFTTYAYANNNPVMMNDPMGDMAADELANAINALWANGGGTYSSMDRGFIFFHDDVSMSLAYVTWDQGSFSFWGGVTKEEYVQKYKEIYGNSSSSLRFIRGSSTYLNKLLASGSGASFLALTDLLATKNGILVNIGEAKDRETVFGTIVAEPGATYPVYDVSGKLTGFNIIFKPSFDLGHGIIANAEEIIIHELGHVYSGIVWSNQISGGVWDLGGRDFGLALLNRTAVESTSFREFDYQDKQTNEMKSDPLRLWQELRSVMWQNMYRSANNLPLRKYYDSGTKIDLSRWVNYSEIVPRYK